MHAILTNQIADILHFNNICIYIYIKNIYIYLCVCVCVCVFCIDKETEKVRGKVFLTSFDRRLFSRKLLSF